MGKFIQFGPDTNKLAPSRRSNHTYTMYKYNDTTIGAGAYNISNVSVTIGPIKTIYSSLKVTIKTNMSAISKNVALSGDTITLSGTDIINMFSGTISSDNFDIYVALDSTSGSAVAGLTPSTYVYVNIDLKMNFSPSTVRVESSPVNIGEAAHLIIENSVMSIIHNLSHRVTIAIPDTSYARNMDLDEGKIKQGSNDAYFTIPEDWLSVLSNQSQATVNLSMVTYAEGEQVGAYGPIPFNISVPDEYKPSISNVSVSMTVDESTNAGKTVAGWGVQLQGYSVVSFKINAKPPEGGGAEIKSYKIVCGGETIELESSESSQELTMNKAISVGGNVNYTATVTDTRNRTTTTSGTFYVYPYSAPSVRIIREPYRCKNTGIADIDGESFALAFEGQVSSCGNNNNNTNNANNKKTLQVGYSISSIGEINTLCDDVTEGQLIVFNAGLDKQRDYFIYMIVVDSLGNKNYLKYDLMTAPYAIHVMNGGTGVAFGKVSIEQNCVEINKKWKFKVHDEQIDDRYIKRDETVSVASATKDGEGNEIAATYMKKSSINFYSSSYTGNGYTVSANGNTKISITGRQVTAGDTVFVTGWNFIGSGTESLYLNESPIVSWVNATKFNLEATVYNGSQAQKNVRMIVYYVVISK